MWIVEAALIHQIRNTEGKILPEVMRIQELILQELLKTFTSFHLIWNGAYKMESVKMESVKMESVKMESVKT